MFYLNVYQIKSQSSSGMEQMNHCHLLTIVYSNLSLIVLNLDAVVNTEHDDAASFAKEHFWFGWVCCVCFVVQCHARDQSVVFACKYKESWSLVVFYPLRHGETKCYEWVFWAACGLGESDLLTNLISIWLHPISLHWCTTEEHKWSGKILYYSSQFLTRSDFVILWLV